MKRFLALGLLLTSCLAGATSNEDHAEDKAQIRALLEQLYTDGQNPNLSKGEYLQRYFLPKSLKQLQVVSGPNGERKKWDEIVSNINSDGFQAWLDMLSTAGSAPINFYTSRQGEPIAVIDVTFPRKPKFTKYQGKWYASM